MNTFQLLKNGASFKRERIEKVAKLFDPIHSKAAKKAAIDEQKEDERYTNKDFNSIPIDKAIPEIDMQIGQLKEEMRVMSEQNLKIKWKKLKQRDSEKYEEMKQEVNEQ